jgi:type IV secretion system protein VirD4
MRFINRWSARLCRVILIASFGTMALSLLPLFEACPILMLVVGFAIAARQLRRRGYSGWEHGTAMWADKETLALGGLLADDGLILGRIGYTEQPARGEAVLGLFSPLANSERACRRFFESFSRSGRVCSRLLRMSRFIHLGTFAPAGKGKSVSCLIPNLLCYRSSCVVTDPKGELATLTAGHRIRKLGHRCIVLDPCHITKARSARLNPLTFIDSSATDFLDQCRDLANMLVIRQGTEPDPHWNDSAELVLCAFIAYVCACETKSEARNLQTVRKLLSSPDRFTKSIEVMQQVEGFGGVIAQLGNQLRWHQDRERASILSVVSRQTSFLDSPAIQENTKESSFDPSDLRSGRLTIYLVLPPERLTTLAPLMRMWLGTILRVLTRGRASEKSPVLFLLDEAAQLGKMPIIEDAVTLMRGYGIRVWLFFQSLDQLHKCYGDRAPTILENLDTTQFFGFSSYTTAEEVSRRIGDTTIGVLSQNESTSRSHPTGGSAKGSTPGSVSNTAGSSVSQTGRRLIKPEELMTMDSDSQVIFSGNLFPIPAKLVRWYADPEFVGGNTGRQRGHLLGDAVKAASVLLVAFLSVGLSSGLADYLRWEAASVAPLPLSGGSYELELFPQETPQPVTRRPWTPQVYHAKKMSREEWLRYTNQSPPSFGDGLRQPRESH